MGKNKRLLVLNKGAEKFIFRYDYGCEDELLDVLIEQAKDKGTDFDWFDAAVLSFKLTQSLIGSAKSVSTPVYTIVSFLSSQCHKQCVFQCAQ